MVEILRLWGKQDAAKSWRDEQYKPFDKASAMMSNSFDADAEPIGF